MLGSPVEGVVLAELVVVVKVVEQGVFELVAVGPPLVLIPQTDIFGESPQPLGVSVVN